MRKPSIAPIDRANEQTISTGHPPDWVPPEPEAIYDLVVIGAGPAGLTAALTAAATGKRSVALVERNLMGGTCVNFGCTPSKALIRAARALHQAHDGMKFGYRLTSAPSVDFAAVMTRVREMRAATSAADAVTVASDAGVHVFFGDARFASAEAVEVNGHRLAFRKAILATGSGPVGPGVPGLDDYLTNETVFELSELPGRLVCVGGGTVNCELAQSFRRLGSEVDLIGRADRLLPDEMPAASALVAERLMAEGVRLHLRARVTSADARRKRVTLENGQVLSYDTVLVAAGRAVHVDGFGLEAAGVAFDARGVKVDDQLRTTNANVYACGDVALPQKYTHAAIATGGLATANALDGAGRSVAKLVIPRCTYTDPEIAHVGLTPAEAEAAGRPVCTYELAMSNVERARIDGETDGFVALHVRDGVIVGATLASAHAGESLPLLTAAVMQTMTPRALAAVIHSYPTQAEAVQAVAAQAADALKQ